jgi:hypothetical protein
LLSSLVAPGTNKRLQQELGEAPSPSEAEENNDEDPSAECDNNPIEDMMPDSWTFPGFITFALLGPIVPNGMMQY